MLAVQGVIFIVAESTKYWTQEWVYFLPSILSYLDVKQWGDDEEVVVRVLGGGHKVVRCGRLCWLNHTDQISRGGKDGNCVRTV